MSSAPHPLKRIWKDKGLLLLCFVLAFLSWQGIRKKIRFETTVVDVPLEVVLPEGWVLKDQSPRRVSVVFRGSPGSMRFSENPGFRIIVPIRHPKGGIPLHVRLTEAFLRNPTEAQPVRFTPSEAVFKLDREVSKVLPVKADVRGEPAEGLRTDRIVCRPATIRLSGPFRLLEKMESVRTEPVDLSGRTASFSNAVSLAVSEEEGLRALPDWVSLSVALVSRESSRRIEGVPVKILSPPGFNRSVRIRPETVSIQVRGAEERVGRLRMDRVLAYVDCSGLGDDEGYEYELKVVLRLPEGISLTEVDPTSIRVEVSSRGRKGEEP